MTQMQTYQAKFKSAKRLVIKIGSALLVDENCELRRGWLAALGADIAELHQNGVEVLIVSSGSIALGRGRLGLTDKALVLSEKQACAATGQSHITQSYEDVLAPYGIMTAQALLTLLDTENRRNWLNARSTLNTLIELGAVPIINENDTVSTMEIRYGDNDRLAARVAQMVGADMLILLSDIDGLYTADPRLDEAAEHIPLIEDITPEIEAMGGEANAESGVGSGGMATKIVAAKIATQAGCNLIITKGEVMHPLRALEDGARASLFTAVADPMTARKQWISGTLAPAGTFTIDDGARGALEDGNSLLAAGVKNVEGDFEKGNTIAIATDDGHILAYGLTAYSSLNARKIMGLKSSEIKTALGFDAGAALIHRDDLAMF